MNGWGAIKRRPSQGLLNNRPVTEPTEDLEPYTQALARTFLVPMTQAGLSQSVYTDQRKGAGAGQPLIFARTPYASADDGKPTRTFRFNNVIAQEWYWQQLVPGSQGTITGRRLGTKAIVPLSTQPIPQRGPAYNRTIHGVPLAMAFPSGGDPGT